MEKSFVMIKPDGVQRGLVGEIIGRLERCGLKLHALRLLQIDRQLAAEHYRQHEGKAFYEPLLSYITSGPVVAMVWGGPRAVALVRKLTGATDPQQAQPGTIRGDLALDIGKNIIHASDSVEAAEREISLFFKKDEVLEHDRAVDAWLY